MVIHHFLKRKVQKIKAEERDTCTANKHLRIRMTAIQVNSPLLAQIIKDDIIQYNYFIQLIYLFYSLGFNIYKYSIDA
jgi:hypothetical protein